ncbi:hypothetical protein G9A89_018098 [Geosiphon pyriformis]|nr:hypothetical protein G9A89_018098 [Geosiphon pyriformis]
MKTNKKGKNKLKQYSKTTPNTPILSKTTANHLQTPEQETSSKLPLTITSFPASLAQAQMLNSPLNQFVRPEDFTSLRSPIRQQKPLQTSFNLLDFLAENQSEHSETAVNEENKPEISEEESINNENKEDEITTYIAKIPEFNGKDIETSSQEWLDQVTKAEDANKWNAARMLRTILYFLKGTAGEWFENLAAPFNDWNAFKAAFLEQFTDNNTSITLCNCFRNIKQEPSESVRPHAPEDLNSAIQHVKRYEMAMEEANCTKLVNLAIEETSSATEKKIDQLTKKPAPQPIQQQYQQPPIQHYQVPVRRLITQNQFTPQNQYQKNRIFTSEGRAAAQQQNPSYTPTTIPPARITENANLSDIFPFEFKANESPFLLSNTTANEQKAIMAMYTEAEVERKTICLILNSRSTGIIVTTDGMKKTPVGEINNFLFTLDGITIPVKVLIMDAPQYQALIRNDWLQKANANLNWETQELTISYQGQHARVPATCGTFNKHSKKVPAFEFELEEEKPLIETFMALGSMSNWANKTEQEHFIPHSELETSGWNIPYSKSEPRKQCPYIFLKYKDCHKKLLSMGACILPKEEYENHTCYYCKACYRKQWGHLIKKTMRGGVCDQTCQYALSISEKVKRGTLFNAAYNSALNKLYHYLHDAEMIFDLEMALINGATKENVRQMKEAEYIEYTMELAEFNYKDEVKVYHQIASYTYPTQEAQIQ